MVNEEYHYKEKELMTHCPLSQHNQPKNKKKKKNSENKRGNSTEYINNNNIDNTMK